jgi:hypothetical protein
MSGKYLAICTGGAFLAGLALDQMRIGLSLILVVMTIVAAIDGAATALKRRKCQ